jgi:hypothetical protein
MLIVYIISTIKVTPAHAHKKAKNTVAMPSPVVLTPASNLPIANAAHDFSTSDPLVVQLTKSNDFLLKQNLEANEARAKAYEELLKLSKQSKDETVTILAEGKKEALELKDETIKVISANSAYIENLLKEQMAREKEKENRDSEAQSKAAENKFLLDMATVVVGAGDISASKTDFMKNFINK